MDNSPDWLVLDNAAKVYPAASNRRWSALFRLSMTLTEAIDPALLQQAQVRVAPRFPMYHTRLERGAFWYYLERSDENLRVRPEGPWPCMPLRPRENDGYLFRVLYYRNRITVEFFHALTDGSGGLCYLKTLVAEYLTLRYGADIPRGDEILDCDEPPQPEESEDSFFRYAGQAGSSRREAKAYRVRGTLPRDGFVTLVTGKMPVDVLLKKAREKGVSLTTWLTAVLILAVQELQEAEGLPRRRQREVKINVPVNLRKFFPSRTLRNFASYVNPGIDPRVGAHDFDEILNRVYHFLGAEVTPRQLLAKFTANVRSEQIKAVRIMPLFIKNFVLKQVFLAVGDRKSSTCISNLGNQVLPAEMAAYVTDMAFVLGPLAINPVACSTISYNGVLTFHILRTIREPALPRAFFRRLVELGVPVEIESNDRSSVCRTV
ncbi:MAG: hypothetical protein FWE69_02125 [Clostridiales bacterium]|nr:hypothetical protein [Clostridiales bacterium]